MAFSACPLYAQLLPPAVSHAVLAVLAATVVAGAALTLAEANVGRHALVGIYVVQALVQLVPLGTRLLSERSVLESMLPSELQMLAGMAACYLVGSQVYAHATPALWPDVFGYHELWHLLVAVGSALSYGANCSVLVNCTAERACVT